MSVTTIERGAVIITTGERRFTTEYSRTDCSRVEKWILPDGSEIEFRNGPLAIGPSRWVEIDEAGMNICEVSQADIMRAR